MFDSTLLTRACRYLLLAGSLMLAQPGLAAVINSVTVLLSPDTNTLLIRFNSFGEHDFKRAYINGDNNDSTGYCGGYELLIENGELYQHTGRDGSCDWSWVEVCAAFAVGDKEDRTVWSINAANLGAIGIGNSILFEIQESNGTRTRQEAIIQDDEVSEYPVLECAAPTVDNTLRISRAGARVDLAAHAVEVDFHSHGYYQTKAVLIDADNDPTTGHLNHLSSDVMGFDLLIEDGYVMVYTGSDGSDDFSWLQLNTTDQSVGSDLQSERTFWSFDTCQYESYPPGLKSGGGVLFYVHDQHLNYRKFEGTLEVFTSTRPASFCGSATSESTGTPVLLADIVAARLVDALGREDSERQFFLDGSLTSMADQTDGPSVNSLTPNAVSSIESPVQENSSGGGVIGFLLPLLAILRLWRARNEVQNREGKKATKYVAANQAFFARLRKIVATETVLALMATALLIPTTLIATTFIATTFISTAANAVEPVSRSEDYIIQFTVPQAGKFWIDVQGALTIKDQQLMQALLSSSLVRINETIWNNRPVGIPIRVKRCGASDAYYDAGENEILLCWELYEDVTRAYASLDLDIENAEDFARGFLIFVLYHEIAHAIADFRETPNIGNSESNADGIATVLAVEQGYSPFVFVSGLLFRATGASTFGGIHPSGLTRAGDLICWASGGDPRAREMPAYTAYLQTFDSLGRDCATEYRANKQLIIDVFPDFIRSR